MILLSARLYAVSFVNGGFESGLAGWTASGNVTVKSGAPIVPVEGAKVAVFNGGNSANTGRLTQLVTVSPGLLNRLEFHAGNLAYNTLQQRVRVQVSYRIGTSHQSLVDQVVTIGGQGGGKTNWQASAFEFTSPVSTVEVVFSDFSLTTNSLDLVLDRVRLAPSYQVNVGGIVGAAPGAVDITVTPGDVAGATGGATPFLRTYPEGTGLTLTAPVAAGGYPFDEWRQNGVRLSGNPQITVMIDSHTTLEAVYSVGSLVFTPSEPFETSGTAGTGPFSPPGRNYLLTNTTGAPVGWSIAGQAGFDAPLADWVTITPSSGVIGARQELPVVFTINAAAMNLPAGIHKAVFKLFTPFGDQFITVYLTANPASVFPNGGFESDLAGWTAIGNVSVRSGTPYGPTEGVKLAAFNGGNSAPNGVLRRSVATVPGHRYRLEFDTGNLSYNSLHQRLQVDVGEVIGVTTRSHVHDLIDIPGPGGGATAWIAASYDFTAIGNLVTMVFADVSQATNALDLVLDDVRLSELPALTLTNGGFESGLDGWNATGNVAAKSGAPYVTTDGTGLAVFNSVNSTPNGSLSQEIQVNPGVSCRLEFDVGNLAYNALHQRMRVQIQYRIFSIYYTMVDEILDIPGPGGGGTAWQAKGYDFTPPAGPVIITFTDVSTSTNSTDLVLDRVRLTR